MPRKRMIEIQQLAQRIEAELESGRADDADLSDEQVDQIAGLLRPVPAIEQGQVVTRTAVRALRRTVRGAAGGAMAAALLGAPGAAAGMAS